LELVGALAHRHLDFECLHPEFTMPKETT
jgi:hypothetical protein